MKNVISRVKGSQPAPILLVANKLDLECQREVATSEGILTWNNILLPVHVSLFQFLKLVPKSIMEK